MAVVASYLNHSTHFEANQQEGSSQDSCSNDKLLDGRVQGKRTFYRERLEGGKASVRGLALAREG